MIRSQLYKLLFVPTRRNRAFAVLLLLCLGWGTTAEFTHHHGAQAQGSQRQIATPSNAAPVPQLQSNNSGRTSSRLRAQAECLICQLHQNLSSSEINQPSLIGSAESKISCTAADAAVHLFEFADTRRGRAPPTIL